MLRWDLFNILEVFFGGPQFPCCPFYVVLYKVDM